MMGASLGVSVILLSACGGSDDNPMLEAGVPESIAEYIQHPFMFYDKQKRCVEYFSKVQKNKSLKKGCDEWIDTEYGFYSGDLKYFYQKPSSDRVLPSRAPTMKEFQDPKMWQIVNNIINGKK